MPDAVTRRLPAGCLLEVDLDPSHDRPNAAHRNPAQRPPQVAHQHLHEPRTVLPFERELLVMDDYRLHGWWSSAASAARCPLRTAASIVAGRPVPIQSPARNRPGTRVYTSGRGG